MRLLVTGADQPVFLALKNARPQVTIGNTMRPWQESLADHLAQE